MQRRIVILIAAAAAAGCDRVPKPAPMDPISAEEAAALAGRFEHAIEPCDPVALEALIDVQQLLRTIVARSHVPGVEKRAVLAKMSDHTFLGRQLCLRFPAGTSVALLRVLDVNGERRPLFRVLTPAGLEYYEVIGGKSKTDGAVRIVDLYTYNAGQTLSDKMAAAVDTEARPADVARTMDQIDAAFRSGDRAEERRLITELPAGVRDEKATRLMEIQAARALDAPDYGELIDRYVRAFPGEPSTDLMAIDGYFLNKQVTPLLAALDRIDRRVGGDPYLDSLRANALTLEPTPEHLAEADRRAHLATQGLPDREATWWILVTVQLKRRDYTALVPTLDKMTSAFSVKFDHDKMAASELWQGFLASPEFAPWWARVNGHAP